MALRLYNSRTRSVEPFTPSEPGKVRMYVCGLTPSAHAHLGHARSFLFFDVLRRYFIHNGYQVTYVQNVTDIDDRTIAQSIATGRVWTDLVEEYYATFTSSMNKLGVMPPDIEPRATKYIPEICTMISGLLERGHAYVAEDAVYFRVSTFERYGTLAGRNVEELLIGARVAPGEHKDSPLDFALWKFARPGEPSWPTPWGAGRPGWHIECSAMSQALLGVPLDIHGGGTDLVFPHHENEIAQTESLYSSPLAYYWLHGGLLLFEGKKMSKSLGNFEPMADLLMRHDPQAVRLLFLQTGYRKPMNFTEEALVGATSGMRRLRDAAHSLNEATPGVPSGAVVERLKLLEQRFFDALDDDINTSLALSILFEVAADSRTFVEEGTSGSASLFMRTGLGLLGIPLPEGRVPQAPLADDLVIRFRDAISGMGEAPVPGLEGDTAPAEAIAHILEARIAARRERNYARSDHLRDMLAALGVIVKDDRSGSTWSLTKL